MSHIGLITSTDWKDCKYPRVKYASLYEQSTLSKLRILNVDLPFPGDSLNDGAMQ